MKLLPLITLPIDDPVLKFLIILIIILSAPLILNKFKVPPLIGLIIAGAVIGPYGFNLVVRDSSIILSGTAGLLYIMFLAGLEIDMPDFKKNSGKSIVFGLYTFIIPMLLGTAISYYILGFSLMSSILLASMFASHTLIAYPLVSKLGVVKNTAVTITVGGTVITDTLALLVLTVIVGMVGGQADNAFWIKLGISITAFALFVLFFFPWVTRLFFKKVDDNVSQYIFVLAMVFLGAYLAHISGLEPIIGAFLAGLALNRLIPSTSPLMNRVEFVGNAIFIPFFLLGVGMLIDFRAFFTDFETIKVGIFMILTATAAKWAAAWCTQKTFGFSEDQRNVIFGLSNAQAAATLAAVTVGYNVILGTTPEGEPIRLLNDAVLNGTILMILVTCTIASLYAQKGANNIAMTDVSEEDTTPGNVERLLISVKREDTVKELIQLSTSIKSSKTELFALKVIDNKNGGGNSTKTARKILNEAVVTAAATDDYIEDLLRHDISRTNAILGVMKEREITDLLMELPEKFNAPTNPYRKLNDGVLSNNGVTAFMYRLVQPLSTIKRHLVMIPEWADKEVGFSLWIKKIWRLAGNTGCKIIFYCADSTQAKLREIQKKHPIACEYSGLDDWSDFLIMSRDVKQDDCMWVILNRRDRAIYGGVPNRIPEILSKHFDDNSFVLVYPTQGDQSDEKRYLT